MDEYTPVRWADAPAFNIHTDLDTEIDQQFLSGEYHSNSVFNKKVSFFKGDITKLKNVEAIVNAARPSLLGGGGVDGAIHKSAGPGLLEACKPLGGCKHGEAKITGSFEIGNQTNFGPNRDLHTFEQSVPLLEKTYLACLDLVLANDIRSVVFSAISTGAYRFPSREACHITLKTIRKWLETNHEKIDLIVLCVFTPFDEAVYIDLLPSYFPKGTD